MKLLRLAIESQRWDLAAHTIVLVTARLLSNGERPDGRKSGQKKGCAKGEPERAAHLMSASINLLESMGTQHQPSDRSMIDLYLNTIKEQLDEATFLTAWEYGKNMTLDEAHEYALVGDYEQFNN